MRRPSKIEGKVLTKYSKRQITLRIDEFAVMEMTNRLLYQEMTRATFFDAIIEGLLEEHPSIMEFIRHYKETTKAKKYERFKEAIIAKEMELEKEEELLFRLEEDEIEDMFDIFDEEG
jgi:hypothetical protein